MFVWNRTTCTLIMGMSLHALIQWEQLFVWFIIIATIIYFWTTKAYGYWSSKSVPFEKPVPFFGNIFRSALGFVPNFIVQQEIYNKFKDEPYVGTYLFSTPRLMLRDPKLVEEVMIRDFGNFMDRTMGVSTEEKGLTAHLLNMTGGRWKNLRNKLAPVFTSGKLKMMMDQLEACSDKFAVHLNKKINSGEPLEAKYLMSGYTLDVIGSCAFGLEFNAIDDPNSTFRKIGEIVFAPSRINGIRFWLRRKFPMIMRLVRKWTTPFNVDEYFIGIINKTIKHREESNVTRNDFIQLLMDIRKQDQNKVKEENEVVMDDRVITSNAFVFLLAGYETTASTLSFMLYELAVNQDIQERLHKEIVQVLKKHNNVISWECLKDMTYLEQVVAETLRKYPPAVEIGRSCSRPYTIKKGNLEIPVGCTVSVPVYSFHHDPQYFPNPEKFDPERFSEANKDKIVKSTYLPFGDGPRICIGMRFASMEIKIAVTRLIQDFSIKLHPKTISPLQFSPSAFLLAPIGGIWLNFDRRNKA